MISVHFVKTSANIATGGPGCLYSKFHMGPIGHKCSNERRGAVFRETVPSTKIPRLGLRVTRSGIKNFRAGDAGIRAFMNPARVPSAKIPAWDSWWQEPGLKSFRWVDAGEPKCSTIREGRASESPRRKLYSGAQFAFWRPLSDIVAVPICGHTSVTPQPASGLDEGHLTNHPNTESTD